MLRNDQLPAQSQRKVRLLKGMICCLFAFCYQSLVDFFRLKTQVSPSNTRPTMRNLRPIFSPADGRAFAVAEVVVLVGVAEAVKACELFFDITL